MPAPATMDPNNIAPGPRLAVGIDLVEVVRIAAVHRRHPVRFLTRHFTPRERAECAGDHRRLAGRWAAKEAVAKALGTGIGPIRWADIEVIRDTSGAPNLRLTGAAARKAAHLGLVAWSLSISNTGDHAVAVAAAAGLDRCEGAGRGEPTG